MDSGSDGQVAIDWPPLPDYGVFERWPQNGTGFIHPADVAVATRCIPSRRVLRRERFDGTFYHYRYGRVQFRLRPAMWSRVKHEGLDVGDDIEVISLGMKQDPFVGRVFGMHFVRLEGCIFYRLKNAADEEVKRLYKRSDLRLLSDKTNLRPSDTLYPVPKCTGSRTTKTIPLD